MNLSKRIITGATAAILTAAALAFSSFAQEPAEQQTVAIAEEPAYAASRINFEDLPTLTDEIRTKLGIPTDSGRPCVIDFGATWCLPCLQFEPTFAKYKRNYLGRIDFASCDYDRNRAIASKYRVQALPTIMFFDVAGRPVMQFVGPPDATTFDEALKVLLELSGLDDLPSVEDADAEWFTLDGREASQGERGILLRRTSRGHEKIIRNR